MKKLLIITSMLLLITTINAQVPPTTFEKVSDSLWIITEPTYGGSLITKEAIPVDHLQLTYEINKRTRTAGLLGLGAFGCSAGAFGFGMALINGKNHSDIPKNAAILFGIGAVGLGLAATISLIGEKVYLTPEGIILKLNKPKNSTNVQQKQ